jgi:hypothetical protein
VRDMRNKFGQPGIFKLGRGGNTRRKNRTQISNTKNKQNHKNNITKNKRRHKNKRINKKTNRIKIK